MCMAFCRMSHFRKQLIKWFSLKKHSFFFDKETINPTYRMILALIVLTKNYLELNLSKYGVLLAGLCSSRAWLLRETNVSLWTESLPVTQLYFSCSRPNCQAVAIIEYIYIQKFPRTFCNTFPTVDKTACL